MRVVLNPKFEKFVREQVEAGRFTDADQLVNHALESFVEREESEEYKAYLRRELAVADEQFRRGETSDFTAQSIIAECRSRHDKG